MANDTAKDGLSGCRFSKLVGYVLEESKGVTLDGIRATNILKLLERFVEGCRSYPEVELVNKGFVAGGESKRIKDDTRASGIAKLEGLVKEGGGFPGMGEISYDGVTGNEFEEVALKSTGEMEGEELTSISGANVKDPAKTCEVDKTSFFGKYNRVTPLSVMSSVLALFVTFLMSFQSISIANYSAAVSKKKAPNMLHPKKMVMALACCILASNSCFALGSDVQVGDNADNNAKSFSVEHASHSLLRGDSDEEDPVSTIVGLSQLMHSISTRLVSMQRYYKSGEKENAAADLKSLVVNDLDYSAVNGMEMKQITGSSKLPDALGDVVSSDVSSLSQQDVPNAMLGEFLKPEIYDDLVDLSLDFSQTLAEMDLSPLMTTPTPAKKETTKPSTLHEGLGEFFKSTGAFRTSSKRASGFSKTGTGYFNFAKYPSFTHQQMKLKKSLPEISTFLSVHDHARVMEKHKLRQQAIGDVCLPQCEVNDSACNCGKLFECVRNIDEYDLAVLSAGGYIETTEGSDKYGEFSVSADELNLFDLDGDIRQKLKDIKDMVHRSSSDDQAHCNTVLEQFHSACDPNKGSCSRANQQSFQVTIDQVCEAVNSKKKLKFEIIGDEFDSFADQSGQPVAQPLSYDACRGFATQFERLYTGRNVLDYPHSNPMKKKATASLTDSATTKEFFDQIQFPIEYNFPRSKTGVVSRTFKEENFYNTNQFDRVFMLRKLERSRTLGLKCNSNTLHDDSAVSVKFKLNENDQLESVECPGRVISLSGPDDFKCLDGIKLILDDARPTDQTQKWRFYKDRIVNLECGRTNGNLAITEIQDDSFDGITFLENIDFSLVNPYNGKALGVGDSFGYQCFNSESELKNAVAACASPTDQNSSSCLSHKEKFGWPMNVWCFDPTLVQMNDLFKGKTDFNEDISAWDTSYINSMRHMFHDAYTFNADIGGWDVSSVEDMKAMFANAQSFNADVGGWNTSKVEIMQHLFSGTFKFNQFIGKWDASNVVDMSFMFYNAMEFNGDISGWNTGNVRDMRSLFDGARKFNADISRWDTAKVESMWAMFLHAKVFNQDISKWVVQNVRNMDVMFRGASDFNQNLCPWGKFGILQKNRLGIFEESGCTYRENPTAHPYVGPLCGSDCNPNKIGETINEAAQQQTEANKSLSFSSRNTLFRKNSPVASEGAVSIQKDNRAFVPRYEKIDGMLNAKVNSPRLLAAVDSSDSSVRHIDLQDFDGSHNQLFRISRDQYESGMFKIFSSKYPGMVVTLPEGACRNNTDVILMPDRDMDYGKWKYKGGAFENVYCKDMVIDISGLPSKTPNVHIYSSSNAPEQKWIVKSDDLILMKGAGSGEDAKYNVNQSWTPEFVDSGYDLGLHPGFPGIMQSKGNDMYLSSAIDRDLAKSVMHSCDRSMELLIGSQLSVGTLTAIADLVSEKGPDRMPGYCCLDVSTNSDFFGYDFDPETKDDDGKPMQCMNNGPWHLGISDEACENAGGKFIRTPCVTLKETIDKRPSRFDLEHPLDGTCQDNMHSLDTAFVSASTSHEDFPFKGTTVERCTKFCSSLPDYSLQTGMVTTQPSSDDQNSGDSCSCLYQNDKLPSRELMPSYAMPSPPKFTLANSNGMALGIRPKIDCDSSDDLIIEAQISDPSNPRQQFQITEDGRVVSVKCPAKVLTAALDDNDSCDAGVGLKLSTGRYPTKSTHSINSEANEFTVTQPSETNTANAHGTIGIQEYDQWGSWGDTVKDWGDKASEAARDWGNKASDVAKDWGNKANDVARSIPWDNLLPDPTNKPTPNPLPQPTKHTHDRATPTIDVQRWVFDKATNIISNAKCPNLAVSSNKKKDVRLSSIYFALQNPRTGLAIGVKGTENDCANGMSLEMQEMVYGSSNQQFIYVDADNKIFSVMCPNYAIVITDGNCDSADGIHLSSENYDDKRNKWLFDEGGAITSMKCHGKFLTIGASGGRVKRKTATKMNSDKFLNEPSLPDSPEPYNNNKATNKTVYTEKKHVETEWEAIKQPSLGSTITLSDMNAELYQKWNKEHQVFFPLMGPFSLVNPTSRLAVTVENGICASGMTLKATTDELTNERQQFYLGAHGAIFSAACPGLVISLKGNSTEVASDLFVELQTFRVGENKLKWTFSNGMIESATWPGAVIVNGANGLTIQTDTTTRSVDCSWRRVNTRLLGYDTDQTSGWMQEWSVSFISPGFENTTIEKYVQDDEASANCYTPNPAFSASFEEFASELVINDASDEDQCRKTREGLGFDKDYPFDTDVRDSFYQNQCDPFFTGVDHVSGDDLDPLAAPPKAEMIEYTPVEYEAVEYEAKEYVTIDYEQFSRGDDLGDLTETTWPDLYIPKEGLGDLTNIPDGEGAEDQTLLASLSKKFTEFDAYVKKAQMVYTFITEKTASMCAVMPQNPCVGASMALVCTPNPAYFICRVAKVLSDVVSSAVFEAVNKAYQVVKKQLTKKSLGASKEKHGYYYSRAIYLNTKGHNEWNQKALEAIRVNIKDQHMQMKKQLQERHRDIANHVGQDVADAQNALGQAIVSAENAIGQGIVDAQNSLGKSIVNSQNALGQSIADAQNYITLQHNNLSEWLHENMCAMYKALNGECDKVIGPLQEDQEFIPIEFHWPDGQLNMVDMLEHVQNSMLYSSNNGDSVDFTSLTKMKKEVLESIKDKVDCLSKDMHGKAEAMEDKVDVLSKYMQSKIEAVEVTVESLPIDIQNKFDALSKDVHGKVDALESKVDAVQMDLKELKDIMFTLVNTITKE